jgi:DNA replication protein DnaC
MDLWLNQVTNEIGGCNELTSCIIQKISVIQAGTTLSSLSRPKGVLVYGKPGTGKTAIAASIASKVSCSLSSYFLSNSLDKEHSKLPYYILNSPDIFQAGKKPSLCIQKP